jgi:sn-glycerol 3-phosphate transport system permease protein
MTIDKKYRNIPVHIILITACFFVCFPVIFALIKSSQNVADVITPSLIPGKELWDNIKVVWLEYGLGRYMRNSLIIAASVTAGKIVFSLLAATALVFYEFPGKKIVFGFIILTLMMPTEILILGLFDVVSLQPAPGIKEFLQWVCNPADFFLGPVKYGLGIGDSFAGIILPFLASATGVFLFFQHFKSIPSSIADSARIDGTNSFQFLTHVLIPMSGNTIGALTVIQFVYVWDQYIWPRVIIRHNEYQVVQVGLNALTSAGDSIMWNQVMAGSLLAMIPPLIVFALLYRAFMNGYALSSNK